MTAKKGRKIFITRRCTLETKERFMKKLIKMKRQPIKAPKTLKADRSIDDIIDALASSQFGRIILRVAPKHGGRKRQDKT